MAARLRLLPLLLLAGCAAPGEEASHALQAALASSQRSLAALSAPEPPPLASPPGPPSGPPSGPPLARRLRAGPPGHAAPAHRVVLAEPAPPGTRPVSAAQLLGAAPETLRRWLGEPALRRVEGSAEIWLYTAAACALDLVLYREGGGLRVAHAAARASGTQPSTEDGCLRDLAALAGGAPIPAASGSPATLAASPEA